MHIGVRRTTANKRSDRDAVAPAIRSERIDHTTMAAVVKHEKF
jgi:hypothetical protein